MILSQADKRTITRAMKGTPLDIEDEDEKVYRHGKYLLIPIADEGRGKEYGLYSWLLVIADEENDNGPEPFNMTFDSMRSALAYLDLEKHLLEATK